EVYRTRTDAEQALWAMTQDGRADCNCDRRYRALVLLATFASLRWGEVTALRRCDIDLDAGTVRVRAAYAERSTGEIILGPPKSKASRRTVGIPRIIVPDLRHHLAVFPKADPGPLAFPVAKVDPLRLGNSNRSPPSRHAAQRPAHGACTRPTAATPETHSRRPVPQAWAH